jgi:hypothetical protein
LLLIAMAAAHTRAADGPVGWPALSMLDALSERCALLVASQDVAEARRIVPSMKLAAETVAKDSPPKNAKQPEQVKVCQADLKSLAAAIDALDPKDVDELAGLLAGVHAVVEQLMEAVGMPHVHQPEAKEPK